MIGEVNHTYFDEIDTEEKAYFLGFLYAGCSINEAVNRVVISARKEDLYILERMSSAIQQGKKLIFIDNSKYRGDGATQLYRFDFFSEKLKNSITMLDINKIPIELQHHFIRGLFDKKGYITFTGMNNPRMRFSGTKEKLELILNIFEETLNITTTPIKRNKSCFSLVYYGKEKCVTIREYLYTDATIFSNARRIKMEGVRLEDAVEKSCSVDGCNQPFFAKGYCNIHYRKYVYRSRKPKNKEEDSKYFTIDRTGEVYKTKQGTDITIVVYRNYLDCDIINSFQEDLPPLGMGWIEI